MRRQGEERGAYSNRAQSHEIERIRQEASTNTEDASIAIERNRSASRRPLAYSQRGK